MEIVIVAVVVGIALLGVLVWILTGRDLRNSQGLDHAADASHAEAQARAYGAGAARDSGRGAIP
ncbi:hypothetical protein [Agromyces sp. M3QZ16-3]|uniref:hypothetical protein n=1 Tax=Agromyces sp. M3QZ16-3 TaxID=3447585 RepID=UPI003F68E198